MAVTKARNQIVPSTYRFAEVRIEGIAPILMHRDTLLDFMHPLTRQFRELAAKKPKTIDDEMNLARIEWEAGIYHDKEIGPYIPAINIKEALSQAATRWKKGAYITRSVVMSQLKIPLEYDGPRDLDELWREGYYDMRGAVNNGPSRGRVPRCRACFEEWSLTASFAYDPRELDADMLEAIAEYAQVRGLGDYRPDFGVFSLKWTEGP